MVRRKSGSASGRAGRWQPLLLFFLLQALLIPLFLAFMQREKEDLYRERQTDLANQYRATTLTYQRLARFVFSSAINREPILDLVAAAGSAGERDRARRDLLGRLTPLYRELRRAGFRQVHFHLPDGTSFLRLHLPLIHGDDLKTVRPSVARMIRQRRDMEGFEVGRHWHAYRFLFPLWRDGTYLGSVELSLPLATLMNNLRDSLPCQVRFLVSRTLASRHLDPDYLHRHYQASKVGTNYLVERVDRETVAPATPAHAPRFSLSDLPAMDRRLRTELPRLHQPASFETRGRDGAILTSILPISDISGHKGGFLIFHEYLPYLDHLRLRYLAGWLALSAIFAFLIWSHHRFTRELRASHAELDQIFNSTADGIRILDLDGIVVRANRTFAEMAGLDLDKIIGQPCHRILGGESCHGDRCPRHLIDRGRDMVREEVDKIRPDGSRLTCLVEARPFYGPDSEMIGIIEDFRDISGRKQLERRLEKMARTDGLTGLLNRRGFMAMAGQQLHCLRRSGHRAFLLFADLDNMKLINDRLGHAAGDRTLRRVAEMLRQTLRRADVAARMGGDEFAVLMGISAGEENDPEAVILGRIEAGLARLNRELPPEQRISISFGLVEVRPGISLEETLREADRRMYAVKEQRKRDGAGYRAGDADPR